jgi:ribosome biogenesis GTPase
MASRKKKKRSDRLASRAEAAIDPPDSLVRNEGAAVIVSQHAARESKELTQGKVFRKSTGAYFVNCEGNTIACSISNRLRKVLVYPTADPSSLPHRVRAVEEIRSVDPIAVGDEVRFATSGDGTGMITEVLPRRTAFARRATGRKPLEHVMVANVDQIVAVFAVALPAPKWNMLDRYLADAEATGVPAVVCMTKLDLDTKGDLASDIEIYRKIGYPVILTSAVTGLGIEELKGALSTKASVLLGKSGVGKTTLLNAIEPGLGLRVAEVSKSTEKGRHTTSHFEMFELGCGGNVVDTPGTREFGLWDVGEQGLAWLFREMQPHLGKCKFGADCSHVHEPGCAVRDAVESGDISELRYRSYVRMRK